jgi:parallel beta-helix repeat protein
VRLRSILIVSLFVLGGFAGFLDFGSENAVAPPTYISGIVYDGAGGPWTLAESPYIVVGEITVPQGQILTIEPGVEVKFDGFYRIFVDGNLSAIGTQNNRINITSNMTTPSWGDWNTIWINPTGRAEIQYCDISYADIGIYLTGSSNNNISNNNISNNGAGMSVGSSNSNITNNNVFLNDYWGIALGWGIGHNWVANNNISSNKGEGIYLYSGYGNNIIGNNISNNSYYGILAEHGGRNMIADNNISLNGYDGIILAAGIGYNITNNNISSNNMSGVRVSGYDNNILRNNITSNGNGITVAGNENRVAFNNVSHNVNIGLGMVGKGVRSITENNTVFENQIGIRIYDMSLLGPPAVTEHLISGNTVFNNTVGIQLRTESTGFFENVDVLSNSIFENDIGINISGRIRNYYISKNVIEDNRVGLQDSRGLLGGNYIVSNTIINNQDNGIIILDSFDTHINHNNFINNGLLSQAIDNTDLNSWNTSYPLGGNYWSDYSPTCQDLFDGPITPQTAGSPDGICDIQYDIDLDSADYYPLTTEYEELAPPTNLSAELTGGSLENVTISWNASIEDPVNVTNYAVYYNSSYDGFGRDYEFLTEFPASGASMYYLTVAGIGEGDPNNYFFFIQANTSQVFRFSRSEHQVAKYTRDLPAGKHLISIPLILESNSIPNVLQTVKFDVAWYYNNSDLLDPWKSYNPAKSIKDLATVDHTMGLWLVVNEDCNFTVAGTVPRTADIQLKRGWNLVGYPSFIERWVLVAMSGVNYERAEGYSPLPPEYLRLLLPTSTMTPGYGYWIKMGADEVWTVEN